MIITQNRATQFARVSCITRTPRNAVSMIIRLYQRTISPDHGVFIRWMFPDGFCRYYPSCSEYGRLSVLKHGAIVGIFRSMLRVLRCNPWSRGGIDDP